MERPVFLVFGWTSSMAIDITALLTPCIPSNSVSPTKLETFLISSCEMDNDWWCSFSIRHYFCKYCLWELELHVQFCACNISYMLSGNPIIKFKTNHYQIRATFWISPNFFKFLLGQMIPTMAGERKRIMHGIIVVVFVIFLLSRNVFPCIPPWKSSCMFVNFWILACQLAKWTHHPL